MTVAAQAPFACAPMQAGLIFESLNGRSGDYVQQVAITCDELLDHDALRRAWFAVVRRHDTLRTSFAVGEASEPLQHIHPEVDPGVVSVDWRHLATAEREDRWRELLAAERQAGFEPAHPPLMRVAICRCDDEQTRMLWTYHHAILDGRSRVMLLRELFDLHDQERDAEPCDPAPPPAFERFAVWAAGRGRDPATEAFWREALAGVDEPTPAPGAAPTEFSGEPDGGSLARRLDPPLSAALRAAAEAHDLTVATILLGAYALLLAQESDRDDVLFATTRAGRRSAPFDTSGMVGLLMVTSPVRLRVLPHAPLAAWLSGVRAFGRAVRDFEHAPLSDLQRWSDVPRPLPLANTLFSYENSSMNTRLRATDQAWEQRDVQLVEQLDYPLTLEAFGDDEILVKALYDPLRIASPEAARVLDRYEAIVRGCAELLQSRPECPVSAAYALPAARRRELSGETVPAVRTEGSDLVPARVRDQVRRHPGRVAVERAGRRLTYAQLDARTNELAAQLAHAGATPGTLVAVAMSRTPDVVCALLAVHRTGAGYVPLDPRYPAARLAFMLEDSGAGVVVTDERHRDVLPAIDGCTALVTGASGTGASGSPPAHAAAAGDLSHVIYTSGSTGRPKGVLVEQGAVAQLTAWAEATFCDEERDGMLASTSLSFDLSVFEILVTLALGGRVVLVDDILAIAEPDFSQDVAFVNTVPSALTELMGVRDLPRSVRGVALAGEALPRALVNRLYAQPSIRSVYNLYGPSEDTTYSTAHRCVAAARPLIGRPLPGTRAYVVDRHLEPVPEGVAGELLLAGQGLARGYLGRPQLTSERFVDVRFDAAAPERVYRTGDRVAWTADGLLDYRGRLDDQVKIRGVRVEPGELEHALRQQHGVEDAAVVVRGEGADRELVAYVVMGGDGRPDPPTLRAALAERLPASLLPGAIVPLAALPLTPNGKLDRRALNEPVLTRDVAGDSSGAVDAVQRGLGELWSELLGLSAPPAPTEDFFALGGHSLLALRLLVAIEDRFGRRLPVGTLLEATTLAAQAAAIEAARGEPAASALVALRPTGSRPPWICVLTDHRGVMGLRNVLPAVLSDQPVYAMQAIDPAVASWRSSSIEQIADACLAAVRKRYPQGPYRLGGHSLGGLVAFEMACRLTRAGDRVETLILLDTVAPETSRRFGRMAGQDRELRSESLRRRARGQAGLARNAVRDARALAKGDFVQRSWPRGFDDPWDQAGAARIIRRYRAPRLRAPVTVINTESNVVRTGSPALGWSGHVLGPIATPSVPGDHLTIFNEPDVHAVAAVIAKVLAGLGPR